MNGELTLLLLRLAFLTLLWLFVFGVVYALRTDLFGQRVRRMPADQAQPGDLVWSPGHIGIYAGDGRMYDSPRTGRTTGLHRIWSSRVSYGRAA